MGGGEPFRKCAVCSIKRSNRKNSGTFKQDVFLSRFPLDENRQIDTKGAVRRAALLRVKFSLRLVSSPSGDHLYPIVRNSMQVLATLDVSFENMAFTEKVSLSGTALSFLLYECTQSQHGQEGFLLGDVTSEVTSHISDSQGDQSRLDTEIIVRTVLPVPAVAQVYRACGRVCEERVAELLASAAAEVVGWYKYRRGTSLKPTMRDKMVTRGLQRYFERNHGRRNFVICNVTSKESSGASTHTFSYRFGKMNVLDAYEHVEDVTPNLGEKLSGYRKPHRRSMHGAFTSILRDNNVRDNSIDAIQRIQAAVDSRLLKEVRAAAVAEKVIRELEAEIHQMTTIMAERHCSDVQAAADERMRSELAAREKEMAEICAAALAHPADCDLTRISQYLTERSSDSDDVEIVERKEIQRAPSPVLVCKTVKNYAAVLKSTPKVETSMSSSKVNTISEVLIDLDMDSDDAPHKEVVLNDHERVKCIRDSSPDY